MNPTENTIKKIAFLVSCASVLQIAESMIPYPVPGIRLGLANMIALVALAELGFRAAVEITLFRTVISSFILGTFLSPAFFLSVLGGLISTLVMGLLHQLSSSNNRFYIILIGISLLGAVTHNLVQIIVVYLFLIKYASIFLLLPWIGISSVVMGWTTGLVAAKVCSQLQRAGQGAASGFMDAQSGSSFKHGHYMPKATPIHRMRAEVKIISVLVLALVVMFYDHLIFYSLLQLFLLAILVLSRVTWKAFLAKIKKLSAVIFISMLIPALLSHGGNVLIHAGRLHLTKVGLLMGTGFAFKIVLLMTSASLLIWTTSPEELTLGLSRLLSPLKALGFPQDRMTKILTLSWVSLPELWDKIRSLLKKRAGNWNKVRTWIPAMSDIIATLYLQIDQEDKIKSYH